MTAIHIYTDDMYPFYGFVPRTLPQQRHVDVSPETLHRWEFVERAFRQMQDELALLEKEQRR